MDNNRINENEKESHTDDFGLIEKDRETEDGQSKTTTMLECRSDSPR